MISHSFPRLLVASAVIAVSVPVCCAQLFDQSKARAFANTPARSPAANNLPAAASPSPSQLTPEMRGDIYMARKMFREAIEKFRECEPSASVENKIGIAFHQLMLLKEAKKSYQTALKLDPKFPQAVNNLGTVYYSEKNYRKAMKQYRKALKLQDSASVWVNLGSAYFAKHDVKHAAECYDKAMRLDPQVFERRSQYGTLLQERTVEDRALFHLYLAKAYAQRGDKERALLYLRKSFEEGLKERKKVPDMPEFASLKTDQSFQELLLLDPKPL
jgi:tetratricopeptide (TPR) repeat protein